ncbi:MAG TPA: hypothetical protein DDZ84_04725 [Firmicutes bacterium]|nr:hypothetical protein [Bacillota bacterium]
MPSRPSLSRALAGALLVTLCAVLVFSASVDCAAKVPGGVTSRVKKINEYMAKVEQALAEQRVNRNDLDRAQQALDEIIKGYPDYANIEGVRAAAQRIEAGRQAIEKLEKDKVAAKEAEASAQKTAEAIAEQWAERLELYKADSAEGAKGRFGVPMSDAALIAALKPQYEAAMVVYEEFLKTGIDKESHWKLRQAEYDIRVSLENYRGSVARLCEEAHRRVREIRDWLVTQETASQPNVFPKDQFENARVMVAGVRLLYSAASEELRSLEADLAEAEALQAAIDAIMVESRCMKPDAFREQESAMLKKLAEDIVTKAYPGVEILRIHVVSSDWVTERVEEWTDTTKTAWRVRVTRGLTAQAAVKLEGECLLYTIFLRQDTIDGTANPLTGHIMFTDRMLEKNLPPAW